MENYQETKVQQQTHTTLEMKSVNPICSDEPAKMLWFQPLISIYSAVPSPRGCSYGLRRSSASQSTITNVTSRWHAAHQSRTTLATLFLICDDVLGQWFSIWGSRFPRGVVNHFWRGHEQIFVYTAVLHLLHSSFKWGSSGCYNGSRYKKRLKTTCFKKQWLKWTKQAHQRHTNYGSKWVGNSRKRPRPNFRHAVKDFCCTMDAMEIRTGKRSLFRSPCQTRQLSRRPCQQEPTLRPRGSTP